VIGHKAEVIGKHLEAVLSGENLEENISIVILRNSYFDGMKSTTKFGRYSEIAKYTALK